MSRGRRVSPLPGIRRARQLLDMYYDATVRPAVRWCWDQPGHHNARLIAASMALDGCYGGRWPGKPRPSVNPKECPF